MNKTSSQGICAFTSKVLLIFVSKRKYLDKEYSLFSAHEVKLLCVSPCFITINCSFLKQQLQIKFSPAQHIQYFFELHPDMNLILAVVELLHLMSWKSFVFIHQTGYMTSESRVTFNLYFQLTLTELVRHSAFFFKMH